MAVLLVALMVSRLHGAAPVRWSFLLLVALGMLLRFWAGACLGAHGNAANAHAPELQRGGPYRFSRNPLYLSNLLVGTGLLLFANCLQPFLFIVALGLLILHHALLVKWEEQRLLAQWGDRYAAYMREVSRWLGRPRSRFLPVERAHPQWNKVWTWQGRNLAYAFLSALLLWGASLWK